MTAATIELAEYDPAWPAEFERERARLLEVLAPWLAGPIEHIGSTAVSGLVAKPVIDIMAGVAELERSRPAIAALSALEYQYSPYRPAIMHWFCKPSFARRTHHLHLVPFESQLWHERLAFRDALRADPELAREYAELKRDLARLHTHDREAYTDAKTEFVTRIASRESARRR